MSMKKMFSGALAIGALLLAVGFTAPAQAQDAPKPEAAAATAAAPAAAAPEAPKAAAAAPAAAAPAAPAAAAFDGARATSTAEGESELTGSGWIIGLLALAAIVVGIVIASDNNDDNPTSP